MSELFRAEEDVLEDTDNWNVGAIALPRTGIPGPVLITDAEVNGDIRLDVFEPRSSTPVYSTTFPKTLTQLGASYAVIHGATVDSLWPNMDTIGHNFAHKIRASDLGAGTLKGGRRYVMKYTIPTLVDGDVIALFVWKVAPVKA